VTDLAELYRRRWQVETALAPLKTAMQMDVLHCKTVPGVLKELTVSAIVYNLVRMVMWQSATLRHTAVERISCLDALRWLSALGTGMPLVALMVIPVRPHRVEPRVKKRRPKSPLHSAKLALLSSPRPGILDTGAYGSRPYSVAQTGPPGAPDRTWTSMAGEAVLTQRREHSAAPTL
jgi:hypothetical protein